MVQHRRIVPRTKLADQGLILLHEADDNAVKWLEDVATSDKGIRKVN